MAYYDSWNADLRYASRSSTGVWTVQTPDLDTGSTIGYYPAMKIPSNNRPGISYYDKTHGDLKFAQLNSDLLNWTVTTVYTGGANNDDVGRYSRDAVDPGTGRWVIAFDNTSGGKGMYTRQSSTGTWDSNPTVIDDTASDVAYTDLAFDASNRPAVSYYDTDQGDLKFAYASEAAGTTSPWPNEVVDSQFTRGLYTNLHYAGLSGGQASWDIIYYNKTGGSVIRKSGTYSGLNIINDTAVALTLDGGANVVAAWPTAGSGYTISFTKNDTTALEWIDF